MKNLITALLNVQKNVKHAMNKNKLEQQRKDLQELAHADGKSCEEEGCQECCDHEFDSDEGYMCLNCDKEGFDSIASDAYDRWKDRD